LFSESEKPHSDQINPGNCALAFKQAEAGCKHQDHAVHHVVLVEWKPESEIKNGKLQLFWWWEKTIPFINAHPNRLLLSNGNAPINLKPAGGGEAGHGVGI